MHWPQGLRSRPAFENCLAVTTMEFVMSDEAYTRALPEGSFCGSSGLSRVDHPSTLEVSTPAQLSG